MTFEEKPQYSLFTLKWTNRRTPLIAPEKEHTIYEFSNAQDFLTGHYKEAIIVKAMLKDILYEVCAEALLYRKG